VSTLESELDEPTAPATWTPNSSPGRDRGEKPDVEIRTLSMDSERNEKSIELSRVRTFGEKEIGAPEERWQLEAVPLGHVHGRNSVGVAF